MESLSNSQSQCNDQSKRIQELESELEESYQDYSDRISTLKSKNKTALSEAKRAKSSASATEKNSINLMRQLAEDKARSLGIDSSRILESITSKTSVKDINRMINEEVDRLDRYRKLPIVRDKVLESVGGETLKIKDGSVSNEDAQTMSFMEQFYSQNK